MKSSSLPVRLTGLCLILALAALLPLAHRTVKANSPYSPGANSVTRSNEAGSLLASGLAPNPFFTGYTVNSLGDTGAGSGTSGDLRYCITQTNAAGGTNVITFSVTGTVNLASQLPDIINNLTITGPGADLLTIKGSGSSVVFTLPNNTTNAISGVTITGGNGTSLVAGGIDNSANLTVSACIITGNTGKFAGAIQNLRSLTVLDSTISNNVATETAFNNAGGISQSNGGTLVVTNCTISGNTATAAGNANGGILIFDGTAAITNCTITDNRGGPGDAGGLRRNFGSMTVANCIVAGNRNNTTIADVGGGLTSLGYNLIGNQGGENFNQPGDQAGTGAAPLDPVIGPLANNGGPTPTHALMGGSPALNAGNAFGSTTDQRGLPRPFPAAGSSDIGAYEAQVVFSTLGNYPNTTVALSANTTVVPNAAPTATTSVTATTSTAFRGTFSADPVTGVLRITNAYPAGVYTVRVWAYGPTGPSVKSFRLTVQGGAPCAYTTIFRNAPDFSVNRFALSMALGDFNGDGDLDLAVGYDSTDPLTIRLGNGAGGFTNAASVSTSPYVRGLAVGDFNGDGKQDLAASSYGSHSVSIRLGDGLGGFSGTTEIPAGGIGSGPWGLAIGDFNGDGIQDLAIPNSLTSTVSIRLGDGAGGFSGTLNVSVGATPQSIVVGDFNGDGKADFATGNYDGSTVSIRLGDGAGGFTNAPDVSVNARVTSVAIGDFNGDGKQDLVVGNENGLGASVRLGDGAGNFSNAPDADVNLSAFMVAVGDFNNDGKQDLVTANQGNFTVTITFGNGAGGFAGKITSSVPANPRVVAVGDFNGDGKQDFAVVHFEDLTAGEIRLDACPPPNSPPSITAAGTLSRQQGNPASNSQIATISDVDQPANTLGFTVTPLSGSGVSVSNVGIAADGTVSADVAASCGATNSTFTLTVTDNANATATATLTVNVTANSAPTLGSYPATSVNALASTTVTPDAAPSDNGTITGVTASSPGFTGTFSVNPATGVVAVTNAAPAGTFTVTVTATDNCGAVSTTSFTLNVLCQSFFVTSLGDAGTGSGASGDLRYCITQANAQPCATLITLTVTGVINLATALPALDNDITLNGPGAAALDVHRNSVSEFGIFAVNAGHAVTISGLTISNGSAPHGGGIVNAGALTVIDSILTGNSATVLSASDGGGAIFNAGSLSLLNTTLTNNQANTGAGGALCNFIGANASLTNCTLSMNNSGSAAAIMSRGSLTVTGSTLSGNVSTGGVGGAAQIITSPATFTNCTISGNETYYAPGGAVDVLGATLTLLNCTITANGTNSSSGAISFELSTVHIKNTIVAGDAGTELWNKGGGTLDDQGNNILSGDPMVAPLGDYGGPTQTCLPAGSSPAIDAGNNAGAPATDQRGVARPSGSAVDIGAVEANVIVLPATIPTGTQFTAYPSQVFSLNTGAANEVGLIGVLPAGIRFPRGTLVGTPTQVGTFPIFIIAAGGGGPGGGGGVGAAFYNLTINCPTITLSPATLPGGIIGVSYSQAITASGGKGPYTFAKTAGTLPPGLILSSAGVLSGTPAGGTYTFTVTATSSDGCTGTQSYSLFIDTPPSITAAAPLSRSRGNAASSSQIASVTDPDQPLNTLGVTATPASGSGVTVTGISVDASGNVTASVAADCTATNSTFTLTVTDNQGATGTATLTVNAAPDSQPPVIGACPANITQAAAANQCSAVVTYTAPTATDNCGATVACVPASGSTFAKGTTTVTCTATDVAGNTAACSFTVMINDTQPPSITCPANVVKPTDPNVCSAAVTYSAPAVSDNCPGVGSPVCSPASGSTFAKGTTTVSCNVSDANGNSASCSFTVTVNDTQAPAVATHPNISQGNDLGQCSAVVNFSAPAATDNCPGVGTVACSPASGATFPKGVTTVTCSATDASGNNGSSTFTVTVNDTQPPTVSCPGNITKLTDANLCSAVTTFTATASDNCPGATVSCTPPSGSAFPKGTTTVSCTATDTSGNQSSACTFIVTVNDTQPPAILCPANIARPTDPNQCSAVVTYAAPAVSDNCPGVGAPVCNPPSGSAFPKGTTTVACTVKDASNNQSGCGFTVTVSDTQPPAIACPPNQMETLANPGDTTVPAIYPAPVYSDNCPGATASCSPPQGSALPLGVTTVTCTATDAAGNQTACSFTIVVFDICLQDDANPATVLLFNSTTGDYLFCCGGTSYTGRGTVVKQGRVYTLTHNTASRRVLGTYDGSTYRGTASLQSPPGTTKGTISDRDTRNNSCTCGL